MSDNVSIGSNEVSSSSAIGGMVVEEVGQLAMLDFVPKRLVMLNYILAGLSEDGRLLLGELRTRGGDDWTLSGRGVTKINTEERKYLDLALVQQAQQGHQVSLVFLVEKKNKERFLTAHHIKMGGKTLLLEDEFASYDKVNVLGKGVTHLAAAASLVNSTELPTVFSASNLLRKLRLEDAGTTLKPTPARAQMPTEGQDGTLSMAVQQTKTGNCIVVLAFKTKSASKNKYMIEWFQSKRDELTCLKTPVKLGENCEPLVLLSDPKDSRVVYALCANRSAGTTGLFKLTKGRKQDDPVATFNFDVDIAALGMSADQNVTLLTYELSRDFARVYTLQKTEGFRGRHPVCASCPPLESLSSPSHIVSCSSQRWQLPASSVDLVLNRSTSIQLALVTLVESSSGRYIPEPDSGLHYRLRVIGCETQGFSAVAILLEDLERVFENVEEKLAAATLKVCLSHPPCRDSLSQISAWLMSGRLGQVDMQYVKPVSSNEIDGGSDRFAAKAISAERFRSYVTDIDWTQMHGGGGQQRQGTFTLPSEQECKSRIPRMSSSLSNNGCHLAAVADKGLAEGLSECLRKMRQDEEALSVNIGVMQKTLEAVQVLIAKNNSSSQEEEEEENTVEEN